MCLRAGDLVQASGNSRRLWVALPVTEADIRRGVQARRPGMHLFSGYWYAGGPLSLASYGKLIEPTGVVVGRIRTGYAANSKLR